MSREGKEQGQSTHLKEFEVICHLGVMAEVFLGEDFQPLEDFALHQAEGALTHQLGVSLQFLKNRLQQQWKKMRTQSLLNNQ